MGSDNIIVNADGPHARGFRPPGRLVIVAVISVSVVTVCAMLLLLFSTTHDDRRLFLVGAGALLLAAGAVGVYWLFNRARQASIVRLPNQHPMTYRQVAEQPYVLAAASLDRHYGVLHAEASRPNPQLTNLNYHYQPKNELAAPELPAPSDAGSVLAAVPVDEWLDWIDKKAHVILAGQTGGGKSTTARAILAPRIARNELVFAIDPHASGWFDLPAVGGGQNWEEVQHAMHAVVLEYLARMQERNAHYQRTAQELPHDHFPRLTVLMDEANEVRRFLDVSPKRGAASPWQGFAEVLGSGARKVGISIILLMQSANVDDLGMTGLMRNNFARVALDPLSIQQLVNQEETSRERRELLYAAFADQSFPAAMARQGRVHLLDRTGLDTRPQPSSAGVSAWPGWQTYQQALAAKQQQQLVTPPVQLTNAERIIELLTRRPHLKLGEVADALGIDKQVAQNELADLLETKQINRQGKTGRYQYFV